MTLLARRRVLNTWPYAPLLVLVLVAHACAPPVHSPPEGSGAAAISPPDPLATSGCEPLISAVARRPGPPRPITRLDRLALDLGERCVAELEEALTTADTDLARRQTASVLALVAGDAVAPRLRALVADGVGAVRGPAVRAATERRQPDDVAFLLGELRRGEADAARAIALLREERARSVLLARIEDGDHARWLFEFALRALDRPPCDAELSEEAPDDTLFRLVLACGVPQADDGGPFRLVRTDTVWERRGGQWAAREAALEEIDGLPTVAYRVTRTAGGERALVDVGLGFGPRAGRGYRYVVRYEGDRGVWRVVQVEATWVA